MGLVKTFKSFRGSDDCHEFNLFAAVFLDEIHCSHAGTAGCQHGVCHNDGALLNGVWKLTVIFVRLMRYLVAVQSDVAYLGAGNQCKDAVNHAKSCTEDGYHGQLTSGNHRRHTRLNGGFNLHILHGKVTQGLITHEHGNLLNEGAELVGSCSFVAQYGNLVLNQRVVKNHYVIHSCSCSFIY